MKALKRFFSDLEVVQQRPRFTIYRIPNKTNKRTPMEIGTCKENPVPYSPSKVPFVFENPKLGDKKYYWCSCGLSKKQPFCDSSHYKTAFKPLPFIIQEKVNQVSLCMCKLTSEAPYCDGKACK